MTAKERNSNLPWVERFRPQTLGDIISHDSARSTIEKLIEKNCLPHLLFYGPPGTGKTTTAHAIATKLYGKQQQQMVLELNASDDRGINIIRDQVKRFASTRMIFGNGHKLIILDESDAMTNVAQAALRRIMEKYSSNVRFIMICNYPEKLIPALRSRCTEFRFPPLPSEDAKLYLEKVAQETELNYVDSGLDALLQLGQGDLRRCLNLMQTTAMATNLINEVNVYQCAGYPEPEQIKEMLTVLLNQPLESAVASLSQLRIEKGLSLLDIVRELHRQAVLAEFQPMVLANLIDNLAQIEKRIAEGSSEAIETAALAAAFQLTRIDLDKH
ncbi:putative replication factor C subunit 5 [Tritrichomonas foetus]|uniref:Replication factor C subunit 5 n=1 Tax=Tritrichomonas foetus TaxID=1144522 RepID=A0A1J4K4Y6_9EUKA|nr:putative replication factor C subunit 5 [Tritrichomonas foetus]|eukprot:OHT06505.1 putative replication factor C subunit 5 [Tritrichomonas foetus]